MSESAKTESGSERAGSEHSPDGVEVLDSLGGIDAGEWDALAGGNVRATHGWLRAREDEGSEGVEPRYVVVRRGGALAAVAACFICRPGNSIFDPLGPMTGRPGRYARRLGLTFLPALICSPPISHGAHLLLGRRDRDVWGERLLCAVEGLARAEGLPLWFPGVDPESEDVLAGLLRRRRYHRKHSLPVTYIDIDWDSFDGYLDHLRMQSRKRPGMVRREIQRNRDAGVRIEEIHDPGAYRARIHDLANMHYLRLNGRNIHLTRDFLPRLKANLKEGLRVYGAFKGGALIGFSVLLVMEGTGHLPLVGIDREASGNDFTYFNLVFYRPISDAIDEGLRRIYLGKLLYEMKARRGASIQRLETFYRAGSESRHLAMGPLFAMHAFLERRKQQKSEKPAGPEPA